MRKIESAFEPIVPNEKISEMAYNALKAQFEKGTFSSGQKLPSENELADMLNISRMTLRSALQKLEMNGYIEVKRGVGTFFVGLPHKRFDTGIERLVSITEVMRQRGHEPGTKELTVFASQADETVAQDLNINVGDPITIVDRIRTMDGIPVMFDHSTFPARILPQNVSPEEIGGSLFSYFTEKKKLDITHAIARLVPAMADDFLAEKLSIEKGTLLIRMYQTHYIRQNDDPVWHNIVSFPDNSFSWFVLRTK
jgi:GntR family transcriptional regulator